MSLDRQHILHYLILFGIFLLAISAMFIFAGNRNMQLSIVVAFSFLYALYGIVHHALEHDLTIKIVIEYVLIALLVVSLFIFVRGGM